MAKEQFSEDQKVEIELMINDAVAKAVANVNPKIAVKQNPDYKLPENVGLLDVVSLEPTKGNPFHAGIYQCQGHQAQMQIRKGFAEANSLKVLSKHEPKNPGRVLGKVEKV